MICKNITCHKLRGAVLTWGQQAGATLMFTDKPKCILEKNTTISFINKSRDP